jgi:uncharacterized membrane protein YdcZ (DUF606 family)
MNKMDLTTKNWTIAIILGLDLLFLALAIQFSLRPEAKDLAEKLWAFFTGSNGALFLLLNAGVKHDNAPPPGATGNPTQH